MMYNNVILTRAYYECNYQKFQTTPPMGLGYLAAYAKEHTEANISIIDGHLLKLKPVELADMILSHKPDLIGVSSLTSDYPYASKLISELQRRSSTAIVIGGIHASVLPMDTLKDTKVDYLVTGEGEIALTDIINGKSAKGIIKGQGVPDLDSLPYPAWDMMRPDNYKRLERGGSKKGVVGVVITSRGCPYNCSFCSTPQLYNRRIRYHSPKNVISQIRSLIDVYGATEIQFEDDNLTLSRDHIVGICEGLIKANIDIPWSCPNGIRADKVDKDILTLMRRAGCHYTAFGIESANQGILNNLEKAENINVIRQAISDAEEVGIVTHGFFILGLPGETSETIEETIQWAIDSDLTSAQFSVLDVLPGSRLWNELQSDPTFSPNWNKVSYLESEWIPASLQMSKSELKDIQTKTVRRFVFSSIRRMWYVVKLMRFNHARQVIGRILRYI